MGASPSKSTKLSLLAVVRQLGGRTNNLASLDSEWMDPDDFALLLWTTLEIESMLGSFLFRSLEAPSKTSDTIFWVAVMRWSAAFLFRELKKVDFSSMRLLGAWLCGLDHGVTLEGPVLRASPGSVEGGVLILLSVVDKVVRIKEVLRIMMPRQKLGKHNKHF